MIYRDWPDFLASATDAVIKNLIQVEEEEEEEKSRNSRA